MAALIEIRDVEKRYTTRAGSQVALRPTSLEIAAEEFVSIVGPSGCGKTTLMKIVAGLLPCTRGEVRIDGVPVQEPPDGVGMVFQAPILLKWRSILQNVLLPAELAGQDAGALRGRALAGASGNAQARIFCREFNAELVAIAGTYKVLEEVPPQLVGKPVQIWLENEKLRIEELA